MINLITVYLSHKIFLIYFILYADDTTNCTVTEISLQEQINFIERFCKNTEMQINLKKTDILVFRNDGLLEISHTMVIQLLLLLVISMLMI